MPRVHYVKKARKDHPGGIKKGDSYYHWKFRYGGKRYSKTRPKRSQLTQSGFLSALWELEDSIGEGFEYDELQDFIGELENLQMECEDSLLAMPEHLQESSWSGELLQSRIDSLEDWIGELCNIDENLSPEEIAQAILDANPGID